MKVGLGGKDVVQTLESEGAILFLIKTRWLFNVRDCVSLQVQDGYSKSREVWMKTLHCNGWVKETDEGYGARFKARPGTWQRDAGLRL